MNERCNICHNLIGIGRMEMRNDKYLSKNYCVLVCEKCHKEKRFNFNKEVLEMKNKCEICEEECNYKLYHCLHENKELCINCFQANEAFYKATEIFAKKDNG